MGPRTRTAMALIAAVVICSYQWMGIGAASFQSMLWPLGTLLLIGIVMAVNASEMRAAGIPIGWSHGRKLPVAGLNFATVVTLLIVIATLVRHLRG
jgi:hypothetical protein